MGREVTGRQTCRVKDVKWVVSKLLGDQNRFFMQEMSGREVTG